MLSVTCAGRRLSLEGLTVDEADALDGRDRPHIVAALLERAGLDPSTIRIGDLKVSDDDTLPTIYQDGLPSAGGRDMDTYIILCARQFGWAPSVTRAQTLRDLNLIFDAWGPG